MPESDEDSQDAIRERAYFIWEREGRPEGRARQHWLSAILEVSDGEPDRVDEFVDEEKVLAGRPDANIPAMLTKDVHGG
jgi:hypothetical protein